MQSVSKTPSIRTIEKVIDETPTVRTIIISDSNLANVLPGQFAMVWIPGVNELPMSIMITEENGKAAFTVRKRGVSSTALYDLKVGQQIGVRGPYGNAFDIRDGKIVLVGGGTGLVPLMRLAKFAKPTNDITILMGSKSKDEVFFENLANRILKDKKHQVIVTTEDGSYGERGFVTDVLERLVQNTKFDAIYTCGPEIMMHKIVQLANSKGIFVQASLERMMKCGIGICGSCCMDEVLVCHDGTIFDGKFLASSQEFGHTHRAKSGILENY
ncbi:dihydroorotate dehydrogenase electron transfer subunit [Candidatus Nitrosotenuis aquarius]|uniref:dihydroorotate dehydrogenase electron transfer subunit n=1 Tax=Candidatus Nitrosotenuis aquarius TaxID=1846278 RepID=UPI001FE3473B|nr:dihydroorotate dehydrogenase electron transfer subunit [Candidatus Nitrosotenuis aquarius]